jgi:p-hydroxybenzoate 3-monooxygenase
VRTQVAIVGAGPAGLLLGHALRQAGIAAIVVERTSRARVEARIRAGILETTMTDLLARLGLDARCTAEGLVHHGLTLVSDGDVIPVDIHGTTGQYVTAYGQTEITRDLIAAAPAAGLDIVWEAGDVALHDVDSDHPSLRFTVGGVATTLRCDVVAGCDGFHGPSRAAVGGDHFERAYPFGWLGVLADVQPCHHEVVYASHDHGFALASMRSPTRSRYYVQVGSDERVEDWPDDRFWNELCIRLGPTIAAGVVRGASIEKSIAPLRSFVSEPMRRGRLFLAGDAAHIVPPTGAKGLNLAASDVIYLAEALIAWFGRGDTAGVDGYSARALKRIWKTERFSWYLTSLMHRFPGASPFERRMQRAELDYIATSRAAQTSIAENYVGLPL